MMQKSSASATFALIRFHLSCLAENRTEYRLLHFAHKVLVRGSFIANTSSSYIDPLLIFCHTVQCGYAIVLRWSHMAHILSPPVAHPFEL